MLIDPHAVKNHRLNRGWTQAHLAEALDISPRTVQRMETTGRVSLETLSALCAVLELDRAELRVDTAPTPPARRSVPLWWFGAMFAAGALLGFGVRAVVG